MVCYRNRRIKCVIFYSFNRNDRACTKRKSTCSLLIGYFIFLYDSIDILIEPCYYNTVINNNHRKRRKKDGSYKNRKMAVCCH
nr:MAG TPA: hypothetical protein [Caudoviricetes sp.]